jgi:hypothetical protein
VEGASVPDENEDTRQPVEQDGAEPESAKEQGAAQEAEEQEPLGAEPLQPSVPDVKAPNANAEPMSSKLLVYGLALAAVFFLILAGWQMASRVSERKAAEEALDQATGDGVMQAAAAAAAAVQPAFTFRGQVPEITDRTLQSVCETLLLTNAYDFVAITDTGGTVLASSDLAIVGRPIEGVKVGELELKKVEDAWQAAAPVRSESSSLGSVVLRERPKSKR